MNYIKEAKKEDPPPSPFLNGWVTLGYAGRYAGLRWVTVAKLENRNYIFFDYIPTESGDLKYPHPPASQTSSLTSFGHVIY